MSNSNSPIDKNLLNLKISIVIFGFHAGSDISYWDRQEILENIIYKVECKLLTRGMLKRTFVKFALARRQMNKNQRNRPKCIQLFTKLSLNLRDDIQSYFNYYKGLIYVRKIPITYIGDIKAKQMQKSNYPGNIVTGDVKM